MFQSIFFFTMWADEVRHGLAGTLVIYLSSLLEKKWNQNFWTTQIR